jgi:hypothetical protein
MLEAPSPEIREAPAYLPTDHPESRAFSQNPSAKDNRPAAGVSISADAASLASSEECVNCTSAAQRRDALTAYTTSWQCSEAALARTARVDPADLTKWKKNLLPVESGKKARIEKVLKDNEAPAPSPKRSRNS